MVTMAYQGKDWESADAFLGAKSERPIANNTRMRRLEDGRIAVRLHHTDVIFYRADGTAELFARDWRTVTTKARLCEFSPANISQEKGVWYLFVRNGHKVDVRYGATWTNWEKVTRFYDGAIIDQDGRPLNPPAAEKVDAQERAEKAMLKRIREYARGFTDALDAGTLKAPGLGDCLYCQSGTDQDGRRGPIGDAFGDTAHFLSHLEESYFVPSLAVNAMRDRGYQDIGIAMYLGLRPDSDRMSGDGDYRSRIVRGAIVRYLKARLLPTIAR